MPVHVGARASFGIDPAQMHGMRTGAQGKQV